MRNFILICFISAFGITAGAAKGSRRVELEDVKIAGELHSDNRLIAKRPGNANPLGPVQLRKSFRADMFGPLPTPVPK